MIFKPGDRARIIYVCPKSNGYVYGVRAGMECTVISGLYDGAHDVEIDNLPVADGSTFAALPDHLEPIIDWMTKLNLKTEVPEEA